MCLINDLNDNLTGINETVENYRNRFKIMCQLCDFVHFHSAAKQLSAQLIELALVNLIFSLFRFCSFFLGEIHFRFRLVQDFSTIFQPILMLHFLWCISALCAALLILQIAIVSILILVA